MLTVLELMNFTEPIFRDSTFGMEQTNNNFDSDENVLDPPLMESTCLDLYKEANDDTDMSLLIDQIVGSDASKSLAKKTLIPVLVTTGSVENADIIENNKRMLNVKTKKRKKMGW